MGASKRNDHQDDETRSDFVNGHHGTQLKIDLLALLLGTPKEDRHTIEPGTGEKELLLT